MEPIEKTELTNRLRNTLASFGGSVSVPFGDIKISGTVLKDGVGVPATLVAEYITAYDMLGRDGATVHFAGGRYSARVDGLDEDDFRKVADFVLSRPGAPGDKGVHAAERAELRMHNLTFIRRYGDLDGSDFEKIAALQAGCHRCRQGTGAKTVQPGDIIEGSYYDGKFPFTRGVAVSGGERFTDREVYFCAEPIGPWLYLHADKSPGVETSGGPFFGLDAKDLEYAGEDTRWFQDWGHAGPCGDGAISFPCKVNRWRMKGTCGI